MKRNIILAIFATGLAFGTLTLTSCSKDDAKPSTSSSSTTDARDLAVGTYTGLSISTIDGETTTDSTTFVVSKGSGTALNITEDGVTITTGNIVSSGSNFGGNIPTQNITVDGATFAIQGKGNNNEQFVFDAAKKSFGYEFQVAGGPLAGSNVSVVGAKK